MAQVNITISGKTYRMACDDGQEAHLVALGERLDQTIDQLRIRFGEIGDQRLVVMAAITMADQHAESERRLRQAEARAAVVERQETTESGLARSMDAIATRLEAIAGRLNGAADGT